MHSISVPVVTSSTSTLKRTHSVDNLGNAACIPQLPRITGETILQVFTHKSLRRCTDSVQDVCGDNERLSELGKKVLETTAAQYLFNQRPMLEASDILTQREELLSDRNIETWVKMYGMREKLRCLPDVVPTVNSPMETRSLFNSYVGGVYVECGIATVQEWIDHLLEEDHGMTSDLELARPETPPSKRMKGEQGTPTASSPTIFFASQPPPSPKRQLPPHLYPSPPVPNPLSPAQPGLPFLPLFNETAARRKVTVEYPAEFSGPRHSGQWTVRCVVNGIPKGVGTGKSKQVAKEEAARQAYYGMGWT